MVNLSSNSPVGSVWGYRIRQTVPAIILLAPYIHDRWSSLSFSDDKFISVFLFVSLLIFVVSFFTEMLGDTLEYFLFLTLSRKNYFRNKGDAKGRTIDDVWYSYLNRSCENKKVADLYIASTVDKLRMQCSLIIPMFVTTLVFTFCISTFQDKDTLILLFGILLTISIYIRSLMTMKELIKIRDHIVEMPE